MSEAIFFAAGVALGAILVGAVLLPPLFLAQKLTAFRNPADLVFYEFERARAEAAKPKTFKLPNPFVKKKPETTAVPEKAVEEDIKKALESSVTANKLAAEHAAKLAKQRADFIRSRQGAPL